MKDNKGLVEEIIRSGMLVSPTIVKAFETVDRKDFVKPDYVDKAYDDRSLPIGMGQTISQPSTVAFMLERLDIKKGEKILDVGSGSGWTTALMSYLVGSGGEVIGIERLEPHVKFGNVNIKKYSYGKVSILKTEGDVGYKEGAPYDKILVSAAAQEIPQTLTDQLKIGGIMVVPVKSSIYRVVKTGENEIDHDEYYGFSFVPLVQDAIEDNV